MKGAQTQSRRIKGRDFARSFPKRVTVKSRKAISGIFAVAVKVPRRRLFLASKTKLLSPREVNRFCSDNEPTYTFSKLLTECSIALYSHSQYVPQNIPCLIIQLTFDLHSVLAEQKKEENDTNVDLVEDNSRIPLLQSLPLLVT